MNDLKILENKLIPVYITDEGKKVVNARELHDYLDVDTRFRTWIKRRLEEYGFEENLDFLKFQGQSIGGRPPKEYILKISSSILILNAEKNNKKTKFDLLKELKRIQGKKTDFHIKTLKREELIFKEELEIAFEDITKIESQFNVLGYRVDFYLPEHNLAIEFDEVYHENQKEQDLSRQKEIEEELGCEFIRIKSEEKLSIGLNKILREVLIYE